jgi:hypothetical protein
MIILEANNTYLKIGFFLLLSFLQLTSLAQITDRLVLEKLGRKNRIIYQTGDEIILKLKSDRNEFKGKIKELYDSIIVVDEIYFLIDDIEHVRTVHTKGFLSPSNGPKLIIAGVSLFLIDQLNHTVIQGNDFRIPKEITIASVALVGAGIFWTSLKYRKFKPGKNRRIRIVEVE